MASKFERIASDLRRRIREGEFPPGRRMPAETELSGHYDVALNTLRRALDQLESEGLIKSQQGTGTFVREARHRVRSVRPKRYQWEKDRARLPLTERLATGSTERDTGLGTEDLDFRVDYSAVPASDDLAGRFGVPPGTQLLRRNYRTGSKNEASPFNVAHSYLIHDVAAQNPELLDASNEPWPGGTQSQLFSIGIEVAEITDAVTARPPTFDETESLDLDPGVSVIVLWKTSTDVNGRVVEVSEVIMPGDRTELVYPIELTRWDT